MDNLQIPDSCSAGQFKVMLQWIDDDQSLSDQNFCSCQPKST